MRGKKKPRTAEPAPGAERRMVLQVIVTLEPAAGVPPGDLQGVMEGFEARLERAVRTAAAMLPVEVSYVDLLHPDPQDVPVFPVTFGGRRFEDPTDVVALFEGLRDATPYGGVLHDAAGRAFACRLDLGFRRDSVRDAVPSPAPGR